MWQLIPIGLGAVMGASRANRQADAQRANNLAQAEVTRYSPWTGMRGQLDTSVAPTALEGALQGGLGGLSLAQGMSGAFGSKPTPDKFSLGDNKLDYTGANSLGGQDMAAQLGQQKSNQFAWDFMQAGNDKPQAPNMYAKRTFGLKY